MLLSEPSKIICRIILDRIQETVDKKLRKKQAGIRKDKSCTDHIGLSLNNALNGRVPFT